AKDDDHRYLDAVLARQRRAEDGRLGNRQPHVEADEDECRARQERNAPAIGEELVVGEPFGQQQEDAAGKEEADRRAELGEHPVPRALVRRRVLDGEQYSAAPLAAESEALAEAAE